MLEWVLTAISNQDMDWKQSKFLDVILFFIMSFQIKSNTNSVSLAHQLTESIIRSISLDAAMRQGKWDGPSIKMQNINLDYLQIGVVRWHYGQKRFEKVAEYKNLYLHYLKINIQAWRTCKLINITKIFHYEFVQALF